MPEIVTREQIVQEILEKHGVTTSEQFESVGYQSECMVELYQYFLNDMPIGTAKARTADPYQWITDRVNAIMGW